VRYSEENIAYNQPILLDTYETAGGVHVHTEYIPPVEFGDVDPNYDLLVVSIDCYARHKEAAQCVDVLTHIKANRTNPDGG
jgi:hypothetical protein